MTEALGTCCACGGTEGVRNIYCLHKKSPTPGRGWGCFQCDRPQDGAVAVVCDPCHDSRAPLKFACKGYPGEDGRVPIEELQGVHEHDMSKHRDEMAAYNGASHTREADVRIIERVEVGENSHGYNFAVGSIPAEGGGVVWIGYACGAGMMFIFPQVSEEYVLGVKDRDHAIKLTGAIAQSPEHGYGGVERWFVDESLRGKPEDFTCENCQEVGCRGNCEYDAPDY